MVLINVSFLFSPLFFAGCFANPLDEAMKTMIEEKYTSAGHSWDPARYDKLAYTPLATALTEDYNEAKDLKLDEVVFTQYTEYCSMEFLLPESDMSPKIKKMIENYLNEILLHDLLGIKAAIIPGQPQKCVIFFVSGNTMLDLAYKIYLTLDLGWNIRTSTGAMKGVADYRNNCENAGKIVKSDYKNMHSLELQDGGRAIDREGLKKIFNVRSEGIRVYGFEIWENYVLIFTHVLENNDKIDMYIPVTIIHFETKLPPRTTCLVPSSGPPVSKSVQDVKQQTFSTSSTHGQQPTTLVTPSSPGAQSPISSSNETPGGDKAPRTISASNSLNDRQDKPSPISRDQHGADSDAKVAGLMITEWQFGEELFDNDTYAQDAKDISDAIWEKASSLNIGVTFDHSKKCTGYALLARSFKMPKGTVEKKVCFFNANIKSVLYIEKRQPNIGKIEFNIWEIAAGKLKPKGIMLNAVDVTGQKNGVEVFPTTIISVIFVIPDEVAKTTKRTSTPQGSRV